MAKLLAAADLKVLGIRLSRAQLWRLEKANRFPRRVRIAERTVAWDADEIAAWLEARKAERGAA
ncbi:helix-turn-helix transcriptional regulator [Dongia rigui]|uniref:AlpA family phage regulatory protein n=1 Tax=Dongia rigui TaxID=940149 RepID=A0ABU5DZS4_9PROT|nr:AlpA family phage regulatory protein [Dongia rigui]MDY0872832.1 AlpA family phage regulatory protein [Dongia rigui]